MSISLSSGNNKSKIKTLERKTREVMTEILNDNSSSTIAINKTQSKLSSLPLSLPPSRLNPRKDEGDGYLKVLSIILSKFWGIFSSRRGHIIKAMPGSIKSH